MSNQTADAPGEVSRPVVVFGSVVVALHLAAVALGALDASSGPWPYPGGTGPATPPQFAYSLDQLAAPSYRKPLGMYYSYRPDGNRPGQMGVYLEAKLRDRDGGEIGTVRIPDPDANAFIRHRQELLVRHLIEEVPVTPPPTEVIPPPGQKGPTALMYDSTGPHSASLRRVSVNLVPRDRPVYRPNDWALVLARSYTRFLCREHGAASAELTLHVKMPYPPAVLFEEAREEAFEKNVLTLVEINP
jgi:hypothetical protein